MDASITSDYADNRSRGRSPQRARASREKYSTAYCMSPVRSQNHKDVPQLDMYPHLHPSRGVLNMSTFIPVLPHEAPVVMPSKRALWLEVRDKKILQRGGCYKRELARDARMKRAANLSTNTTGDFEVNSRVRNKRLRPTLNVTSVGGLLEALDRDESELSGMDYMELYGDGVETAQAGVDDDGNVDLQNTSLRDEDARAWRQVQMERDEQENVDALMDLAKQKYELRNIAKAKKLEAQGWDLIEPGWRPNAKWWAEHTDDWERIEFELP